MHMPNAGGPMACPVDGSTLVMSERSGIEIDYCPQCRGVWLDRGELDKIIARNTESGPVAAPQPPPQQQQAPWGHEPPRGHYGHQKPYKKRRSFLEDLFD
jgi:Zn-finger nucleic acid-binding protein